jgi:hypothetical protein
MTPEKTDYSLLDWDFLGEMAENMQKGLKKGRNRGDWQRLAPTQENKDQYFAALIRHAVDLHKGHPEAAAAVACNAMILADLHRKKE